MIACGGTHAHDPSAWGGVFRSRDFGASWLAADAGQYIGGAMALAIHPGDANHLLFATDTRLLRSTNGGRDWRHDAAGQLLGPVTAVSFDHSGRLAAASNAAGVFHLQDGTGWHAATAPAEAAPARAIVAGPAGITFLLAGAKGIFASLDGGQKFHRIGEASLPDAAATALLVSGSVVFAVLAADLWQSTDTGATWTKLAGGLPAGRVETVTRNGTSLWVAANDALYRSADRGTSWQAQGARLPLANTTVRGIAVADDERTIVLATHRGALHSADGGATWVQLEGTLPVHLEAGFVLRDSHDSQTLYAGFALTPYPELYRRAQQGSNLLAQTDTASLLGGAAFLLLILIAGIMLAKRLMRGKS